MPEHHTCSIVLRLDYGPTSLLFTGDTNGRPKGGAEDVVDDQELFMLRNHDNEDNPLSGSLDCDPGLFTPCSVGAGIGG